MEGLLGQLGIDWKLFLSQAANFFILLLILRAFVYKPLLAVIKKRSEKISEGLQKAKEADIRLKEVDVIAKEKLKQADEKSINIIKATEQKAKQLESFLKLKAEKRQNDLMVQIESAAKKQEEEASLQILKGAAQLVRKIIEKTVELKPQEIDEALIEKAVLKIKDEA